MSYELGVLFGMTDVSRNGAKKKRKDAKNLRLGDNSFRLC
jgi:hypothetical protein